MKEKGIGKEREIEKEAKRVVRERRSQKLCWKRKSKEEQEANKSEGEIMWSIFLLCFRRLCLMACLVRALFVTLTLPRMKMHSGLPVISATSGCTVMS